MKKLLFLLLTLGFSLKVESEKGNYLSLMIMNKSDEDINIKDISCYKGKTVCFRDNEIESLIEKYNPLKDLIVKPWKDKKVYIKYLEEAFVPIPEKSASIQLEKYSQLTLQNSDVDVNIRWRVLGNPAFMAIVEGDSFFSFNKNNKARAHVFSHHTNTFYPEYFEGELLDTFENLAIIMDGGK